MIKKGKRKSKSILNHNTLSLFCCTNEASLWLRYRIPPNCCQHFRCLNYSCLCNPGQLERSSGLGRLRESFIFPAADVPNCSRSFYSPPFPNFSVRRLLSLVQKTCHTRVVNSRPPNAAQHLLNHYTHTTCHQNLFFVESTRSSFTPSQKWLHQG